LWQIVLRRSFLTLRIVIVITLFFFPVGVPVNSSEISLFAAPLRANRAILKRIID
jgi:hypothetical protein